MAARKSRVTAAVCELTFHDGAVDHGYPYGDAVYTMPGRF